MIMLVSGVGSDFCEIFLAEVSCRHHRNEKKIGNFKEREYTIFPSISEDPFPLVTGTLDFPQPN